MFSVSICLCVCVDFNLPFNIHWRHLGPHFGPGIESSTVVEALGSIEPAHHIDDAADGDDAVVCAGGLEGRVMRGKKITEIFQHNIH